MSRDEHVLPISQITHYLIFEIGNGPLSSHLKALTFWRCHIEGPPPDVDLLSPVPFRRLRFVEPLQGTIVPFIEPPFTMDRDPDLLHFGEGQPQSPNGAGEYRGVGNVKGEALLLEQTSGFLAFAFSLLGQVDVVPTGKAVIQVPLALAVSK